jgi:hypothetical protein
MCVINSTRYQSVTKKCENFVAIGTVYGEPNTLSSEITYT